MKNACWGIWAAAAACGLQLVAADRTDDGLGLVEAFTGTSVSKSPEPFRYCASAVTGGSVGSASSHAIERTNANTWAPECVYQLERWGNPVNVLFSHLVAGASYKIELHLTENYFGGSAGGDGTNRRVWNVLVNGTTLETGIDIYKQAGGAWKALCKSYTATADANGQIAVKMAPTKDNAHFSGIALFGSAVPSTPTLSYTIPSGTQDLSFSWTTCTDVHRYYLEKAESSAGPWTGVQTFVAETNAVTLAGAYDSMATVAYRLVASNGVGTAVSPVVTLAPPAGQTGLKTRGETIASDASALYHVDTLGSDGDPVNALASDAVTVLGYLLDVNAESTLALGEGQTLTLGILGLGDAGGLLKISGSGSVVPKDGVLNFSTGSGELHVAVPVAGSGSARLSKNGAGRTTLSGGLSGVSTLAVNAGTFCYSNATDETFAIPVNGAGTFAKAGAGTLTVSAANPSLSGDVVVAEGTLRFGRTGSVYASTAGTLTVEPGAALDVAASTLSEQSVNFGNRVVVVSGSGPDGKGAIVNTSAKSQYNALRKGSLAGDVTFGGGGATLSESAGRWDFRSGSFAMNGHNIEKVGSNMVCLTAIQLTTGDSPVTIDVKEGYWSSETSTSYTQGSDNLFRIHSGALLDLYQMAQPINWSVELQNGGSIRFRNGTDSHNKFTSPVSLAAGSERIFSSWNARGSFYGPVTGEGRFVSTSESAGRVSLYATNTYSGGTYVSGGDLYVAHHDALPGYDDPAKLLVTNGTLILCADNAAWTTEDANALVSGGQIANNAMLGVSVKGDPVVWSDDLSFAHGGFAKYDSGDLTLAGRLNIPAYGFAMYGGRLILSGNQENYIRNGSVVGGSSLILTNGVTVKKSVTSGYDLRVGNENRKISTIRVCADSTLAGEKDCPVNAASGALVVGYGPSDSGLLEVLPGATVRHKVSVGCTDVLSQGAVHQHGGLVENQGGSANDIRVGDVGYGYYELNAGELDWWGYGTLGSGAKALGVMVMHGGLFKYVAKMSSGRLGLSRGGSGTFYMDGGLVDYRASGGFLAMGESDSNGQGTDGRTTFTVDGTGEARFGNKQTWLGNRKDHTAVINLNGNGILECAALCVNASYGSTNRSTVTALLNFNGGTFRAPANMSLFPSDTNKQADAVTLYAGGAVFDASNYTLTVDHALTAASGSGVASIALPAALTSATGYTGSPFVRISGGGGRGATALCTYDSATRKVTGVKITSAGTDYTSAPTVTVSGGGYTNVYTATATLAANATTGGVTVKSSTGTGTVVLSTANAFNGAVRVESGTLKLTARGAFPAGNDLVLAGGTFDAQNMTITAGVVRVTSGTLKNVRLVCTRLEKSGDGVLTLDNALVDPTSVSALEGAVTTVGGSVFQPGLFECVLSGNDNWTGTPVLTNVVLGTLKANTRAGWTNNVTAVYQGYIWNTNAESVTWSFMEAFDDHVRVWVDDALVLENYNWDCCSTAAFTLTPGAHKFQARFAQGAGGAGPTTSCTNTVDGVWPTFGFAIDPQGRTERRASNFSRMPVDPGDGTLFTTLAGPIAFTNPVATAASLSGAFAFTGTWTIDMDKIQSGEHLVMADGALDLTGLASIAFENAASLRKSGVYVLAEVPDGVAGDLAALAGNLTGLPSGRWSLDVAAGKLRLVYPSGTTLILR